MKKIFSAAAAILLLAGMQTANKTANASSNKHVKVTICHRTGNGGSHPITVDSHAVPAHLAHGDALGDCRPLYE